MNVLSEIKSQIKDAMKSKDTVKRDILRLVVGQVQQSDNESDEAVLKIVRKLLKSNNETITAAADESVKNQLVRENEILNNFVPKPISEEEIETFIKQNNIDIKSAKNDGQAMGMLMKPLQATGKTIDSFVVKNLISKIRSS